MGARTAERVSPTNKKSAPYAHTCERINNEQIGNKEEEKQQTTVASAVNGERRTAAGHRRGGKARHIIPENLITHSQAELFGIMSDKSHY